MPRFQKGRSQASVQVFKYGYRVRMYDDGRNMYGPVRDTLANAEADLVRAWACDDKEGLLRRLMLEAGIEEGRGEALRTGERRGDAKRSWRGQSQCLKHCPLQTKDESYEGVRRRTAPATSGSCRLAQPRFQDTRARARAWQQQQRQ